MDLIRSLLTVSERFCAATKIAEATLSTRLLGAGSRLGQIRSGASDIGVHRAMRAMLWLSENWPADVGWPADVDRPSGQCFTWNKPGTFADGGPSVKADGAAE